jgi:hypothetical protein
MLRILFEARIGETAFSMVMMMMKCNQKFQQENQTVRFSYMTLA